MGWPGKPDFDGSPTASCSLFLIIKTFGGVFGSDGRLTGDQDIQTVNCNGGSCQVKVPAPSFALVFLTDQALHDSDTGASKTFSTSLHTKVHGTATIDPSVLATSNGHKGMAKHYGSTSKGSAANSAFGLSQALPGLTALVSIVASGFVVSRVFTR